MGEDNGNHAQGSAQGSFGLSNRQFQEAIWDFEPEVCKPTIIWYRKGKCDSKHMGQLFLRQQSDIQALLSVIAENGLGARLTRLGVHDTYGESGSPEGLYEKHSLDAHGLARSMKSHLQIN